MASSHEDYISGPSGSGVDQLFQEKEEIIWRNVDVASRNVTVDSDYRHLVFFDFAIQMVMKFSKLDGDEKRSRILSLFKSLILRLDLKSSHPSYRQSLNNLWALLKFMSRTGLSVDPTSLSELSVLLTLSEDNVNLNRQIIHSVEEKEYWSSDLQTGLKQLLIRNPHVGSLVIQQLNHLLSLQTTDRNQPFNSLNFVPSECLIECMEANPDGIIRLIPILSEDQMNEPNVKTALKSLITHANNSWDYDHWADYYLVSLSRKSPVMSKMLYDIKWFENKNEDRNPFLLDTQRESVMFKNCIHSCIRDKKHFMIQLMDQDLTHYQKFPRNLKLIYLLQKIYGCIKRPPNGSLLVESCFLDYTSRLETLMNTSQILLSQDSVSCDLVMKIKWIFDLSQWIIKNELNPSHSSTSFELSSVSAVKKTILSSLFVCDTPLKVISGLSLFSAITDSSEDDFEEVTSDLEKQLLVAGFKRDAVILWGLLAIKLSINWIIMSHTETITQSNSREDLDAANGDEEDVCDDPDEYGDENEELEHRIEKCLTKIKSQIKFKTEILEDMFSLLFLTKDDLDLEELQSDYPNESSFTESSSGLLGCKSRTSSYSSGSRDVEFLCSNQMVLKYLVFLENSVLESQTHLRHMAQRKAGFIDELDPLSQADVPSSIKDLNECKQRLNTLLQNIYDGKWRHSLVEPAFSQESLSIPDVYRRIHKESNEDEIPWDNDSSRPETDSTRTQLSTETPVLRDQQVYHVKKKRYDSTSFPSIIAYMSASPEELLRYCLLEGQMDRAEQVYRLFEPQLRESDESRELKIAEKTRELTDRIRQTLSSKKLLNQYSVGSTHHFTSDVAIKGLKMNHVNQIFKDFMTDLDILNVDTQLIIADYGVSCATTLEVSQTALETSGMLQSLDSNNGRGSPDGKIKSLLQKIIDIISAAKSSNINVSLHSIISCNIRPDFFENPHAIIETGIQERKLRECLEDLKHVIAADIPFDTELTTSVSSLTSSVTHRQSTTRRLSAPSATGVEAEHEGKKLLLLFQRLLKLCPPGKYNYLKGLFYYVRRVSKILHECQSRSRSFSSAAKDSSPDSPAAPLRKSYFNVLYQSPSAILCQMVLKENVPPNIVDDMSNEMRVDLIGTLCSVLCPHIDSSLTQQERTYFNLVDTCYPALCELIGSYLTGSLRKTEESIMISNHFETEDEREEYSYGKKIISRPELILYFQNKSPTLVEIMKLLKVIDDKTIDPDHHVVFEKSTPLMKWLRIVENLFQNGSLKRIPSLMALALSPRISFEDSVVMKSLEDYAIKKEYISIYRIFQFVPVAQSSSPLQALKRAVLSRLAMETGDVKYILQIEDCKPRVDLLLDLIDYDSPNGCFSDSHTCIRCIQAVLSSVIREKKTSSSGDIQIFEELIHRLKWKMKEISCFAKISELSGLKNWKLGIENLTEADILTILKTKRQFNLALEYYYLTKDQMAQEYNRQSVDFSPEKSKDHELEQIRCELLILAFAEKGAKSELETVISSVDHLWPLMQRVLPQIENWEMKEVIVTLCMICEEELEKKSLYSDHLLGIKLVQLLPVSSRSTYGPLVSKPTLIIEQMLMNTEYSALESAVRTQQLINCDDLIEIYARKAVDIKIYTPNPIEESGSFMGSDFTCISSSVLPVSTHTVGEAGPFVMPTSVPSKDQWVPDAKVAFCMVCKLEKFSVLFNRRHHCRRCGRVVCASCSDRLALIPQISEVYPVRVCINCFNHMKDQRRVSSLMDRKESISSLASSMTFAQWILTLDENQNYSTRMDFYFEAAPSSSLCLSILRLHSDRCRVAGLILDQMLKPLFEAIASNQVDYGLMISIIKSLLVSSRVISSSEKSLKDRLRYIDLMLSRIDIVKMLVDQNCINRELINYVIFNESCQSLVKLQEKLLEFERFELSLNIAKKNGLDVKGIWKTWAIVCLKNGKYAEARVKFKHVLQERDSSSNTTCNSKNLMDIFKIFEEQKCSVARNINLKDRVNAIKKGRIKTLSTPVATGIKSPSSAPTESSIPPHLLEEAYHYLKLYGSKEDYIKFYSRFGLWKSGLEIFLSEVNQSSLASAFVFDFILAALNKCALPKVLNLIKSADPTLNKSWKYLITCCKYLSKNEYYHVLHTLQVFMSDYIRAAMTQVNFFFLEKPVSDYSVLKGRIEHLLIAKKYLRSYLQNQSHLHSGCLKLTPEQVNKNIRTIDLQIEVTNVFADRNIQTLLQYLDPFSDTSMLDTSYSSGGSLMRSFSMDSNQSFSLSPSQSSPSVRHNEPLTLLDNSKAHKIQIASLISVGMGPSISDGFNLCQSIVQVGSNTCVLI